MELCVLKLPSVPVFRQLQIEEALLRADKRNWCIINQGSPVSIVMGISGKPELLLNQQLLLRKPVPVIRRFSGGGTVIVDEHTCFISFICNRDAVNIPCLPNKILQWSEEIYKPVFTNADFCLRDNDYAFGNKKFGGNAFYLSRDRFLLHSSLLWDFDPLRMEYLLMPPKMPTYRAQREHLDFLCKMKDHYPCREHFEKTLLNTLEERFILSEVPVSAIEEVLKKPHRKATIHVA